MAIEVVSSKELFDTKRKKNMGKPSALQLRKRQFREEWVPVSNTAPDSGPPSKSYHIMIVLVAIVAATTYAYMQARSWYVDIVHRLSYYHPVYVTATTGMYQALDRAYNTLPMLQHRD